MEPKSRNCVKVVIGRRHIWLNGLTNLYRLSVAMKAMPTPVPTDVLISIAELFGISLDALLGLERPTGVSTQGLSASQIKIVEALIQEFRSPTSKGSNLGKSKMNILHDILEDFGRG